MVSLRLLVGTVTAAICAQRSNARALASGDQAEILGSHEHMSRGLGVSAGLVTAFRLIGLSTSLVSVVTLKSGMPSMLKVLIILVDII
jgi:hypothetical protein